MGTMREILFRGKRLDKDEWAEGFLLIRPMAICIGDYSPWWIDVPPVDPDDDGGRYNIDPETVGQYTGLRDKNGKRIFEGDIVKSHYINAKKNDFVEQVVFHNGRFCALFNFSGNGRMWTNLPDGIPHLPQDKTPYMDWCEIIGNIHDNPELLEGSVNDG